MKCLMNKKHTSRDLDACNLLTTEIVCTKNRQKMQRVFNNLNHF